MCGISGIISLNSPISFESIKKMTDIISYRGPDDYGYLAYNSENHKVYTFKEQFNSDSNYNVYLGHRRLSIIDLSAAGHQPMSYLDGKYWIVHNGEIYNYIEIREELKQKGYKFNSNTDTEVILASYHEWGTECLNKFNGMWAFAILDTEKNHLFCARDRLGIKPFYYNLTGDKFSFSSEIKQLLQLPWIYNEINEGFIHDFFVFNSYYSLSELTAFKNLYELRGGNYVILELNRILRYRIEKWWDINPEVKLIGNTDEEYAKKYYEIFYDACKLRLRSDVKVGNALSGGLDSSGVVCVINEIFRNEGIHRNQLTFTASSENKDYDETDYAKIIVKHSDSSAYFTTPTEQGLIDNLDKLIWHQEEPFGSTSIYASWCIASLVREAGVTVSLDGQGPDEMLGGYFPFVHVLADNIKNLELSSTLQNLHGFHKLQQFNYKDMIKKTAIFLIKSIVPIKYSFSTNLRKNFLNQDFYNSSRNHSILNGLRKNLAFSKKKFDDYSYQSVKYYPLPGILKTLDRNSMAFSVESRLPFLDYRLVEYTFSLPTNQKINKGITKLVYRNAMKNTLPDSIINRHHKLGFITSEPIWMKSKLKQRMNTLLDEKKYKDIFNYDFIHSDYKKFLENRIQYSNTFWNFLCTEHWLNKFIN